VSVHHTVIELVVSAVQAEQPNLAVIKANQDAYNNVIQTSEEFLSDQRREYEAQSARMLLAHKAHVEQMARKHQRVMDKIKAENEKMSVPQPSFEDITRSQGRLYGESLEKRILLKAKSMEEKYAAEMSKRRRKEEDLRIAEKRIEQLRVTIKQLEELVDTNPKRTLPSRSIGDSPEQHADKKSRSSDENLNQTSMAPITPSSITPSSITPSSITPSSITPSQITHAKKAEIQNTSNTHAKKAEIQKTSINPAKVVAIQSNTSSSEDESGVSSSEDASDGASSVASIPTWTPDPLNTTIFNADGGSINDSKPNRPTIYDICAPFESAPEERRTLQRRGDGTSHAGGLESEA
jgi:hypothetical protein